MKITKAGIIGLLSALMLGTSGVLYLSSTQLNNAYICTTTLNVGIFDRLSSTNKTGYWSVNGTTKSKVCTNGYWERLAEYAKAHNINIEEKTAKRYVCDMTKCTGVI